MIFNFESKLDINTVQHLRNVYPFPGAAEEIILQLLMDEAEQYFKKKLEGGWSRPSITQDVPTDLGIDAPIIQQRGH